MAQVIESPVSVRLPKYIIKKIDELVKEGEFKSRSDFIKYAVTLTLGQIMMEKAREKAKTITPEEAKARSRQALQKLFTEEIEDEWSEIKDILEDADRKWKELKGVKK
ncbi:ribbon-helix-helix protein, CopG family [Thermococcus barophilus]|uniref:Programmed cell death antitoxin YdcD-like protein n=1 Tax=Thermococcus barophilus (strain DSM 11836 / MP) TaxID=391623 RepID=F0LN59_THEBM|nr:type II toxin-antitoxin system ParD family antitoxin [Thermococcus barophilus]ADT85198.1 Programmed cell death antitoxin YdcD-like protein [Thermococcus barophilus MP]